MKFSSTALIAAIMATSAAAFAPIPHTSTRIATTSIYSTAEDTSTDEETRQRRKKDERLRMMKSEKFHRKGFKEVREKVEDTMQEQFKSDLVQEFKDNQFVVERDGVKVYLAKVSYAMQRE
jgi:4-hydroxy-3-methylbut-2-en-1-yl diphosphate reductase